MIIRMNDVFARWLGAKPTTLHGLITTTQKQPVFILAIDTNRWYLWERLPENEQV